MYDDLTGIISFMKVTNHYVLTNDWHQVQGMTARVMSHVSRVPHVYCVPSPF